MSDGILTWGFRFRECGTEALPLREGDKKYEKTDSYAAAPHSAFGGV